VTEVETRRAIPVECKPDEETASVELRYMSFGADTWKTLKMERKGSAFRVQIPCDATPSAGTLKFYVQGKDVQGDIIVGWGTKKQPVEMRLVEQSSVEPPSYDDADAPARCPVKEICPPDFPGCDSGKAAGGTVDWGGSCGNSTECKSGLLCIDGTCETAPSCKVAADCPAGSCVAGKCAVTPGAGGLSAPYKKWWLGLHVASDLAWISGGDNVCMEAQAQGYVCYMSGSRDVPYDPEFFGTTRVGQVSSGVAAATTRFLLSLDYAFAPNIMAGVRAGFAVGGGPPAGKIVEYNPDGTVSSVTEPGTSFLPLHLEARVSYWFGKNVLARPGLRPYVHGGGGLAQVDADVEVSVEDKDGIGSADAWKKMGQGFITLGGGVVYAFTPNLGAQLNLNCMYMMPASGLVFEPSLGMVLGL
jgi:opacity protein-like surface antigen